MCETMKVLFFQPFVSSGLHNYVQFILKAVITEGKKSTTSRHAMN